MQQKLLVSIETKTFNLDKKKEKKTVQKKSVLKKQYIVISEEYISSEF